uniref:Uncharacterized protein n=1 Tax=Rhizophora mucronata TaxID=61149 RepID=A0A2P2QWR5_RHIMU
MFLLTRNGVLPLLSCALFRGIHKAILILLLDSPLWLMRYICIVQVVKGLNDMGWTSSDRLMTDAIKVHELTRLNLYKFKQFMQGVEALAFILRCLCG